MAKYNIEKFPFNDIRYAVKVTNTETGKHCKFMVSGDTVDPRSPTPGFPGKDEMTKEEVEAELADMVAAVKDAR